jgi:RND family efflux transporter MFP subunit
VSIPFTDDAVPVEVTRLKKLKAVKDINAVGKLSTNDETDLSFKISGVVERVFVNEGDPVRRGQMLARLVQQEVDAIVGQSKENYEKAKRDLERSEKLFRDSVITLEHLQNAQTAFDIATQQLNVAQFNQQHSVVRAPADGVVLRKLINPGQFVSPGSTALITNGATRKNWLVKVGVTDKQWAMIGGHELATIAFDAIPQRHFTGFVSRKSGTVDSQSGLFTVEIALKETDIQLATGMFAEVHIRTDIETEYWPVPYQAILDASGNRAFVFVATDSATARMKPVVFDGFNQDHVFVTEGLTDAEKLIITGSPYLSDKSSITILN